jgi:hypothetical protein
MQFVMEMELSRQLERHLPLEVDYDERLLWSSLRVRATRRSSCA